MYKLPSCLGDCIAFQRDLLKTYNCLELKIYIQYSFSHGIADQQAPILAQHRASLRDYF